MSYFEKTSCRIAIQVCIGYFPDGRERHRTFSMRGVNPDAPIESIAAVIHALAPLLAYPITKVRKVTKTKREIFLGEDAVMPVTATDTRRIVRFPVTKRPAINKIPLAVKCRRRAGLCRALHPVRPGASPRQMGFFSGRAPPVKIRACII